MKYISILFFLIFLCSCQKDITSYFNELNKTLDANNAILEGMIRSNLAEIRHSHFKEPEITDYLLSELETMSEDILNFFNPIETGLVKQKGVFVYRSEQKEYYKKKGINLFEYTEDKNMVGVPINPLDKKQTKQFFFEEKKAEELSVFIVKKQKELKKLNDSLLNYLKVNDIGYKINKSKVDSLNNFLSESNEIAALFRDISFIESLTLVKTLKSRLLRKMLFTIDFIKDATIKKFNFDKCELIARAASEVITLGENLEIYFDLICYEKESVNKILCDGKELILVDGKANLQINTNTTGKQTQKLKIEYFNSESKEMTYQNFEFEFEVIDNLN